MAQSVTNEALPAVGEGAEIQITYLRGAVRQFAPYQHTGQVRDASPSGVYSLGNVFGIRDRKSNKIGDVILVVGKHPLGNHQFVRFWHKPKDAAEPQQVDVTGEAADRDILDKLAGWLRIVAVGIDDVEWFDEKSVFVEYMLNKDLDIVGVIVGTAYELKELEFSKFRFIRFQLEPKKADEPETDSEADRD